MPFRPHTRKLVLWSLATTLVCITTLVIRIPNSVHGYVNFGDSMIFALALLGGPGLAAVAGGLGSALADIIAGYAHYALPTLVIKGGEGFLAGLLVVRLARLNRSLTLVLQTAALALAGSWMVAGYFLTTRFFYGWAAAYASLPGDLLQAALSIPMGLVLYHLLKPAVKSYF